jgi:hypothetical protein
MMAKTAADVLNVLALGAAIPCDDDLRRAADVLNAGKNW